MLSVDITRWARQSATSEERKNSIFRTLPGTRSRLINIIGVPYRIRTGVAAVRGRFSYS